MNDLQLELTKLIGSKELTFGCYVQYGYSFNPEYEGELEKNMIGRIYDEEEPTRWLHLTDGKQIESDYEIIGHPATLSDLHRFLNSISPNWTQDNKNIELFSKVSCVIPYDSSKDLLDQEESTLEQIISLIKSNQ